MDILWAPWREKYVVKAARSKGKRACTFCTVLKQKKDRQNYIFLRTKHSFAVLNIYPFNGGHSLVLPQRHVGDLEQLTADERADLLDTVLRVKALMTRTMKPDAFNVGMNLGALAGAGIPEHVHVHIVPRWRGDINFLPVISGTKVIPVSLDKIYKEFLDADKSGHRKARK